MYLHAQLHNGGTILKKLFWVRDFSTYLGIEYNPKDYYYLGSIGNLSNKRNMSLIVYMQD